MVLQHKTTTTQKGEALSEASREEEIFRRARGILNKITPEKFDTLVRQLLDVGIRHEGILRGIISLLFEKALNEPHFSAIYAQVCLELSVKSPNFEEPDLRGQTSANTFLKLLLANCQDEFESRTNLFSTLSERGAQATTPEQEEELFFARKKMLGNIKFIGELGKRELVSEKILHSCIKQLLRNVRNPNPEDLECLCGLLQVAGKRLDHEKAKAHLDAYFSRMEEILRADLPSRIRFMLLDIIELRKDKWKPRHAEAGPRTLQDIHMDARREKTSRKIGSPVSILLYDLQCLMLRQKNGHRDYRYNDHSTPVVGEYRRPGEQPGDHASPGGVGSPKTARARGKGDDSALGTSPSHMPDLGKPKSGSKRKPELTTEQLTDTLLEELFVTGDVAEAVRCVEELRTPLHVPMVVEKTITAVLDKEPKLATGLRFLQALFDNHTLDTDKFLLVCARIGRADPAQGLRPALVALPDTALDIPHAPVRMVKFCAEAVVARFVTLQDIFQPPCPTTDALFCANVLQLLRPAVGDERVRELYAAAHLDVLRLAPLAEQSPEQQREFLAKNKLEFLYPMLNAKERITALLQEHLKPGPELGASVRAAAKALKELPAEVTSYAKFHKALALAIFEYITSRTTLSGGSAHTFTKEELKAEKDMFEAISPLIVRYTTEKIEAQIDVIYALQLHCHTHRFPKGMILRLARYLYETDAADEDAWLRWREEVSDEDPGKGEALVELNEYLNWLENAETDEDE